MPAKSLKLGDRRVTIASPYDDDEYWQKLEDGADDAFWQVCRRFVRPGDVCFDVGANIGLTSLLLAQIPGVAEVHAFEPGPGNFRALRTNLEANGVADRVTPVQAAVGDSPRRARFLEASAYGHLSANGGVEVEVLTVGGYMATRGLARLDFCKLDIEGFEWSVLRHALPIFERDRTLVHFEFNSWCQLAYGDTNPKHFLDWICATFPAVYAVAGPALQPVSRPLDFLQKNLVHHGCVDDLLVCTDPDRLRDVG